MGDVLPPASRDHGEDVLGQDTVDIARVQNMPCTFLVPPWISSPPLPPLERL